MRSVICPTGDLTRVTWPFFCMRTYREDQVTEPLTLTSLQDAIPGVRRAAHGYATSGSWLRVVRRMFTVACEIVRATPRDISQALLAVPFSPLRMETGEQPEPEATRIALYVHYSASGRISEMVCYQLETLRRLGFSIVFISMAAHIPQHDWQAVKRLCALVVQRQNSGRDFGAWRDLMPEVRRRWAIAEELMLANDSVLGPIRPLAPLVDTMRDGGNGLFGLTESLQGGPHLQSYMLLARGRAAVGDLMRFFQTLRISHSKWLLVQMGEIRMARWMRQRGHRVAAIFGYERLIRAALADPDERRRLAGSYARFRSLDQMPDDRASELLHRWPLNPTHHLWHLLVTRFNCPFLKTELVLRNPGRLPGVANWASVIRPESPVPTSMLEAHMQSLVEEERVIA
jgi:hypothetical protein